LMATTYMDRFDAFGESVEKMGFAPKKKTATLTIAEHKSDGLDSDELSLSLVYD